MTTENKKVNAIVDAANDCWLPLIESVTSTYVAGHGYRNLVRIDGHGSLWEDEIAEAAHQPDNGDGLVQKYQAIAIAVGNAWADRPRMTPGAYNRATAGLFSQAADGKWVRAQQ